MTSSHSTRDITCFVCDALSWRTGRVDPKTMGYCCANGHTWEDVYVSHACTRCGAEENMHIALRSDEYGPILACPAELSKVIFQKP